VCADDGGVARSLLLKMGEGESEVLNGRAGAQTG